MPNPSAGRSTPPDGAEQVVVAAAAADGAQLALGVEQLEDGAGVVGEPAHDGEVEARRTRRAPSRPGAVDRLAQRLPAAASGGGNAAAPGRPSAGCPAAISSRAIGARPTPASTQRLPRDRVLGARPACRAPGTRQRSGASLRLPIRAAARRGAGGRRAAPGRRARSRPSARITSIASAMISASAQRARLADQVAVELEVLPQPAALLPLVAEQLRNREPADRLLEPVGARRHHARQRRRHLRAAARPRRPPLSAKL